MTFLTPLVLAPSFLVLLSSCYTPRNAPFHSMQRRRDPACWQAAASVPPDFTGASWPVTGCFLLQGGGHTSCPALAGASAWPFSASLPFSALQPLSPDLENDMFALIFSATPIPSQPFLSTGTRCAAEEEPRGGSRPPFSYVRPFGVFGLWFNKFSHFSSESKRFRERGVETKNDRGYEIK